MKGGFEMMRSNFSFGMESYDPQIKPTGVPEPAILFFAFAIIAFSARSAGQGDGNHERARSGHRDPDQNKHLRLHIRRRQEPPERDKVQVGRVQHQFHPHKHCNGIPARNHAERAEAK